MSWLFSQALVEEYLEDISLDGEQSVQSSGSLTPQAYCAPDKMTAFSRLSRFGMTFKPLTDILGEELSMSSVVAFHVRTLVEREMARIIYEVRPRYVFVENSPMLTSRGLGTVLGDLASMGFDAKWGVLGAADIGANHQRDRIWIVGEMGHSNNNGHFASKISKSLAQRSNSSETRQKQALQSERSSEQYAELAHPLCNGLQGVRTDGSTERQAGLRSGERSNKEQPILATSREWWEIEPDVGRLVDGLASRVDELKAVGNGQVPLCAATAWRLLK